MTSDDIKAVEDNEDREIIRKKEDAAIALRQDYRNTFLNTVVGRRVFKHLIGVNYFIDPINPSESDAIGRRNAICGIMNMLCCADDPDKTIEVMIEAMSKWPIISKQEDITNE